MKHYFTEEPSNENIFKIKVNLPINNGLPKKTEVYSASNIFSNDEIDLGTKVLLNFLETAPEKGLFLDVGCGWGPVTIFMSLLRPNAKIIAIDINSSALKVLKMNCKLLNLRNVKVMSSAALKRTIGNKKFDFIMSNPPIRVGRAQTIKIIKLWYQHLSSDGGRYLNVIQKNLGADSIIKQLNDLGVVTQKIASKKGFRVTESTCPLSH